MSLHQDELIKFQTLHNQFRVLQGYSQIDAHGFTTSLNPDILFTALTHGNEVIGLQTVNLFLEKVIKSNISAPFTFAVLLNNLKAYDKNERFVDRDLNRSFHAGDKPKGVINIEITKTYEYARARQIETAILKLRPKIIIDLHQTSAATLSPFFVAPEDGHMISMAHILNPDWPIVCFDARGFSRDGHTLSEFARHEKIHTLVIEISQNGFDQSLAREMCDKLFYLNFTNLISPKPNIETPYFKITHQLTKQNQGVELLPGLENLQAVSDGEILGYSPNGEELKSPAQGLLIFPKYGKSAEIAHELGLIATRKILKNE
ncbi:MAG: succinylglutamate desuccinylase/aspartoacylase family protein [Bdellovibrionota bacterium]